MTPSAGRPEPGSGPVDADRSPCRLEPLAEAHLDGLYDALCVDSPPQIWTYMPAGPFADRRRVRGLRRPTSLALPATIPLAILLPTARPVGIATYLRIDHANGTAEVGYITYGVGAAAHHRRDRGDVPDGRARVRRRRGTALRVEVRRPQPALASTPRRGSGFTFEGIFRQAVVYKGRNRDTAWFAITDDDWPGLRARFERWLDPANFDEDGTQRTPLADLG